MSETPNMKRRAFLTLAAAVPMAAAAPQAEVVTVHLDGPLIDGEELTRQFFANGATTDMLRPNERRTLRLLPEADRDE